MPDVPIREILCANCSSRTIQPLSSLEPIIWLQATSSEDGIYINYACPVCHKLTRSRVESETRDLPDVNATKFADIFIAFLKCGKKACDSPVILLAPVKHGVRDADFMTHIRQNWSIDGAECAKGHAPALPYEVRIWKQVE